jgi:hypothetical protein
VQQIIPAQIQGHSPICVHEDEDGNVNGRAQVFASTAMSAPQIAKIP